MATMSPAVPQRSVKEYLSGEAFKAEVAKALPKHLTPDRFIRVALTAITKTPKLAECTQASLFNALLNCSQLGIEPDGRRAHLIPYGKDCQLIIDYKGLIELAKRSGEVSSWGAEIVKENDEFTWKDGVVTHSVDWRKPRGEAQCVYSRVRMQDGSLDFEVMTLDEVDAIRKRSRSGNNGPWVTDYDEMAKKTVIRRHSKRMTLSPEFRQALDVDDDKVIDVQATAVKAGAMSLAEALDDGEGAPVEQQQPVSSPTKFSDQDRELIVQDLQNYILDTQSSEDELKRRAIADKVLPKDYGIGLFEHLTKDLAKIHAKYIKVT